MKTILCMLALLTLLSADKADFSNVSPKQKMVRISQLGLVVVNYRKIQQMGEYSEILLSVDWKNSRDHSQVLYEGMSCAIDTIRSTGNSIIVSQYGNRYENEGHRYYTRYTYHTGKNCFVEDSSWTTDTWTPYVKKVKSLLKKGSVEEARKLVMERGTTPNGGHSYEDGTLCQSGS